MTTTKPKRDLPRELWQEILSRLPVKPVLQFRCVSKSWQSMIDDPGFGHLHLPHSSSNRQQTHLLVLKSINTFNLLTHSAFHENYFTLPTPHHRMNWNPLSSIDGLVMLVGDEKLLLWNPSIRKSRVLPPSPEPPLKARYVDLGFGFDPSINDYKHVRISYLDDGSPQFVAIYTLGSDSWKTIPFQSKGGSSRRWANYRSCTPWKSRGRLFSIALNRQSNEDELVSFDLSNEVFTSTTLPRVDMMFSFTKHLTMVDGECLFVQHLHSGAIVWTMESSEIDVDSVNWRERYSMRIVNGTCTLLPFTRRDIRMGAALQKKLQVRLVRLIIDLSFSIVHSFDYSESLLLLK